MDPVTDALTRAESFLVEHKDVWFEPGHAPNIPTPRKKKRKKKRYSILERAKRKPLRQLLLNKQEVPVEYKGIGRVVRHVRTEAGKKRFGQPIGSIIIADAMGGGDSEVNAAFPKNRALGHLKAMKSEYPGWDKAKGADGRVYYVGKDPLYPRNPKAYVATDDGHVPLIDGHDEATTWEMLDDHVAGQAPRKRTPSKRAAGPPRTRKTTPVKKVVAAKPLKLFPNAMKKHPSGDEPGGAYQKFVPIKPDMLPQLQEKYGFTAIPDYYDIRVNPAALRGEPVRLVFIGLDSLGKAQYGYTKQHRESQDGKKHGRVKEFAAVVKPFDVALKRDAMKSEEAAAALVIRNTGMRVGENGRSKDKKTGEYVTTYGLTGLERRHVTVRGDVVTFKFVGKGAKDQKFVIKDKYLAQVMTKQIGTKKPSDRLFDTKAYKVKKYTREQTGVDELKNHDLRTHIASSMAFTYIQQMPVPTTKTQYQRQRMEVAVKVSNQLGNEPKQALESYIDPALWDKWKGGNDW